MFVSQGTLRRARTYVYPIRLYKQLVLLCMTGHPVKPIGFTKESFLRDNLESAEFTNKKHGKPTLHSLITNHVLEMSVKLKFECVHFETKHCFALVVLDWFPF